MPMLPLLALLAQTADPASLIRTARDLTAAEAPCPTVRDAAEITICGRRRADRFRVPLVVHDPGDPRYRSVGEEREALLHRTTPIEDKSLFLVGGGMAGVRATVGGDGSGVATLRQLAP
jgi:hypothetical protein